MAILADTHVHLYPCHRPGELFSRAWQHFQSVLPEDQPAADCVLCLTERFDCHAFQALARGALDADPFKVVEQAERFLRLEGPAEASLVLLPGRQINTVERIEVLALGVDLEEPDGKPIREVLAAVRGAGALPVVAWAPGKWFFERGRVVASLVEDALAGDLFLGDTTLRPRGWPTPSSMRDAEEKGLAVLCGSDPLPFPGEEARAGTYATYWKGAPDFRDPGDIVESLRTARPQALRPVGRRNPPLTMLRRWKGNRDSQQPLEPS